jgi:hypothetical protein
MFRFFSFSLQKKEYYLILNVNWESLGEVFGLPAVHLHGVHSPLGMSAIKYPTTLSHVSDINNDFKLPSKLKVTHIDVYNGY